MRSFEYALDGLPLYGALAFVHFRLPITQVRHEARDKGSAGSRLERNMRRVFSVRASNSMGLCQAPPGLFRDPSLLGEL
jgi:hypothetical protein